MTDPNPTVIHVVATVVDTERVLFYLVDGSTYTMQQTDNRLKAILDKVVPLNGRGLVAIVELNQKPVNAFVEAEKTTKGFVKFFKVARDKLASWLTPATEEPVVNVVEGGSIPPTTAEQAVALINEVREQNLSLSGQRLEKSLKKQEAVQAAMQQMTPQPKTADLRPHMEPVHVDQTFDPVTESIVGVVDDQVIADMHQLETMLKNMNQTRKVEGFKNFMTRISKVIKERRHSVEDLIRFLERADLPLANDGSVIAYKMLKSVGKEGDFADCHTGRVKQKVGSLVRVLPELVDLSRDRECSNGLHIARRAYLGGFSGDVCVLCKIAPEDFMAVPHQDSNKVRVQAYEILDKIDNNTMQKLKRNMPGSDDKVFLNQLYKAIHGLYPPPVEEVLITAQSGGGLKITPLRAPPKPSVDMVESMITKPAAVLEKVKAFDDPTAQHAATNPEFIHGQIDAIQKAADDLGIDPEDVQAAVDFHDKVVANGGTNEGMGTMLPEPEREGSSNRDVAHGGGALAYEPPTTPQETPVTTAPTGTYRERCQKLWDAYKAASSDAVRVEAAKAIMTLKKDSKKGWDKLGMDKAMVIMIENTIAGQKDEPVKTTVAPVVTKATPKTQDLSAKLGGKKVAVPAEATEGMSKKELIRHLYDKWNKDNSVQNGEALLAAKKQAKKGWDVLGLTTKEIETIDLFLGGKK